jgi:hypothetical protein
MKAKADPTPEEIRLICLQIQSEWSERERLSRLRVDLRPAYTRCDGVTEEMSSDVYEGHHDTRERLQTMADP